MKQENLGNVLEWCLDWFGEYSPRTVTDPKGATSGMDRVCRQHGGASSSFRNFNLPEVRYGELGFRLVRTPK